MDDYKKEGKCCLCGGTYTHWGNNPWPLSNNPNDRCCDECNMDVVIARLKQINNKEV